MKKENVKSAEKYLVTSITNSNMIEVTNKLKEEKKKEEKKKVKKNSIDVFLSLNCFSPKEQKTKKLSTIIE
ncbi:hypothetical protein HK099_007690 [Clydaea vesicula]|uniref:Uncharacterized protein n=1 Tax=Clydaea vesicula TaxID=447962 RepID=A0AAD5XXU8_9FUNG|nr:hypothetical protein HK099_007690 [Clydaea vesicula]